MANILENFDANQLNLIINNEGAPYTFDPSSGDYIRMTVMADTTTLDFSPVLYQFYSNRDAPPKILINLNHTFS